MARKAPKRGRQVHQIELEMQDEESRRSRVALADARDQYFDLFEFAPVGYLTLDVVRDLVGGPA